MLRPAAVCRNIPAVRPGGTRSCWNERRSPARARLCGASLLMSLPSSRTWPVIGAKPVAALISVDLPAPLGPSSAVTEPFGRTSDASSTAVTEPKRTVTSRSSSAGGASCGTTRRARIAAAAGASRSASTASGASASAAAARSVASRARLAWRRILMMSLCPIWPLPWASTATPSTPNAMLA